MLYLGPCTTPRSSHVDGGLPTTLCTLAAIAASRASFCREMPTSTVISSASAGTETNRAFSLTRLLIRASVDFKSAT